MRAPGGRAGRAPASGARHARWLWRGRPRGADVAAAHRAAHHPEHAHPLPRAVVGAGLAGSMMALMLARRGFYVDLYEKRPDFRVAERKLEGDA